MQLGFGMGFCQLFTVKFLGGFTQKPSEIFGYLPRYPNSTLNCDTAFSQVEQSTTMFFHACVWNDVTLYKLSDVSRPTLPNIPYERCVITKKTTQIG